VAKAMIQLMNSNVTAQRFIISAENRSFTDIFNLIAKAFGKKPPHKKVTPFLAKIVWRLEAIKSYFTGKEPLVTKETARTALANADFDNSKLKKYLPGFTYQKIEDSITHTCAVLQQKLNSN
jgi:nucleoside-diphosphate-sugar epimerase